MKVTVNKGRAKGTVKAPSSKSIAHRLLICAALADGESIIRGIDSCEDVAATVDCLRAMGADVRINEDEYRVRGIDPRCLCNFTELHPRESGSTLRFLLPVSTLGGGTVRIVGAEGLMRRPMDIYRNIYTAQEMCFIQDNNTITASGALSAGEYRLPGDVSSQFITGLIFALPHATGDSRIIIDAPFESRSYVDLTLRSVNKFGIEAYYEGENTIYVKGDQRFCPCNIAAEGDYSSSAFMEALNYLGSDVEILGLDPESPQGDRGYLEYFPALSEGFASIDISNCPDLGPILFAVAASHYGGRFIGTRRLRIKESDRVEAMKTELEKLGATLEVDDNQVVVTPSPLHAPTVPICAHNDHRIVMSMAVLLTLFGGTIEGAEAISKSYPGFFRDLGALGIEVLQNDT